VKAKWKTEADKYQYQKVGYSESLGLWIPPENWLVLEFEGTKEQNRQWVRETGKKCNELNLDYCICSHQKGKSPYIWVCDIEGIRTHEEKKSLARALVPRDANLDWTNVGRTLVPVIEHHHWKHKTIHQIIYGKNPLEQKNEYPRQLLQPPKPSLSSSVTSSGVHSTLTHISSKNNKEKIKEIISSDFLVQRLMAGNIKGYSTPSHARMALYFSLVGYGLSDSDIDFIMSHSRGLNYNEKPHLHNFELRKARERCSKERVLL